MSADAVEGEGKALEMAFLYHFVQFTGWPEEVFAHAGAPLRVCVLGSRPDDHDVMPLQGRKVKGHPIEIRRLNGGREATSCHAVYVDEGAGPGAAAVLDAVRGKPVLTVAEIPGFTRRGGIIELFVADNKLRFYVDRVAAESSGLTISSRLLQLSAAPEARP